MGWAAHHIEKLKAGETVHSRPRGNSMAGKIESGQLCTVKPLTDHAVLRVGDIVLCKVHGREYIHLVKAIQGDRFQIGNNRGHINGWVGKNSVFGKCVSRDVRIRARLGLRGRIRHGFLKSRLADGDRLVLVSNDSAG